MVPALLLWAFKWWRDVLAARETKEEQQLKASARRGNNKRRRRDRRVKADGRPSIKLPAHQPHVGVA